MTKKLLALLLAMCMIFSVCSVNIAFAETSDVVNEDVDANAGTEENTTEATEEDTTEATEEEPVVEDSITIDVANNYYPNDKVTVTGSVTGSVTGVIVKVACKEDGGTLLDETITVKKYTSTGVTLQLDDATVGAVYTVTVCDFANEETVQEETFVIKKEANDTSSDKTNNATGNVTIWIEGLTDRYIDKTVVSLKNVDDDTVLGVAEYILEEEGRKYRLSADKSKIERIATTATGSTYLRDGYGTSTSSSSSKYFADSEWSYFVNGKAYSASMEEKTVSNGDEIILYFGNPDEVIYPNITIEPDNGISLGDKIVVTVTDQYGDPVKGASVYFYKRNSTSKTGGKTDAYGVYDDKTANSSFISTYQGGTVRVSYYQSSSKPIMMVSVEEDILVERDGTTAAWVTIEGAHKTLLSRTKSSKISEYDLLNFAMEVFEAKKIDYELNSSKDNFEYLELKNTSGYYNENGDLVRGSGWYVCVNDVIYTPDDDLEDVDVYNDDEILFYFGDDNTVPVVYYTIEGDLETDETVYVYFYSDAEKTEPLTRFDVYFSGDDMSKRLSTNTDGRVTLPTVEYKGTYELSWGEQVGVKDDYCPYAVYKSIDLKYTGTAKPVDEEEEETTKRVINRYEDDDEEEEEDDDWDVPTEKNTTSWDEGDYDAPTETVTGPSPYFPDQNIDTWAVDYVNKAYKLKLMSGTALGWFEPQRDITRAEFTTIICRMLGLDTDADYTQVFSDVKPSDWHYGYIMAAYNAGYVTGMSATTFAPTNYITREEMAVLVSRIVHVTGNESDVYLFADGADVSAWARIYVAAVNKTGLMTGDQFGQFLPKSQVTRQTVAVVAVRLYEYLNS